jgi:hypothetical protein
LGGLSLKVSIIAITYHLHAELWLLLLILASLFDTYIDSVLSQRCLEYLCSRCQQISMQPSKCSMQFVNYLCTHRTVVFMLGLLWNLKNMLLRSYRPTWYFKWVIAFKILLL